MNTSTGKKMADFPRIVQAKIEQGWLPLGGISITPPQEGGPKDWYVVQAMTRG